jgi:hydroxymethylbilane synthase
MSGFTGRTLRIGTRRSPMALAQTARVRALLTAAAPGLDVEVVGIRTEADAWQGDLSRLGGKGLFVKAIDVRLREGEVDLAVHCLKDLPGDVPLPDGLVMPAVLPRDDVRDALVVPPDSKVERPADLPPGALVGSSSVRRAAQIGRVRPDVRVVRVRGAVGTRLDRLDGLRDAPERLDALVVARAGLERLGMPERARHVFTVEEMLPAVGAGVLALECRARDTAVAALLEGLCDARTMAEATAERAMLHGLAGHCNSPIAGHCATGADGRLTLTGMVFAPDGGELVSAGGEGDAHDAGGGGGPTELGARVAGELLARGAGRIISGIPH